MSWADVLVLLPPRFQFSANPARLLEELLSDRELLAEFLFASFLPRRFYGGFGRYPGQEEYIRQWLATHPLSNSHQKSGQKRLRCLDAACGTGEDSYDLAALLKESGFAPDEVQIEGWTLEPLEVWAASHLRFPHDRQREALFRRETAWLFESGYQACIRFKSADLTKNLGLPLWQRGIEGDFTRFDLILCNGLLGGPIINEPAKLEQVVSNLAGLLAPGGLLLAADSFHGGWKSSCRDAGLKELFLRIGLKGVDVGEGIGGLKH